MSLTVSARAHETSVKLWLRLFYWRWSKITTSSDIDRGWKVATCWSRLTGPAGMINHIRMIPCPHDTMSEYEYHHVFKSFQRQKKMQRKLKGTSATYYNSKRKMIAKGRRKDQREPLLCRSAAIWPCFCGCLNILHLFWRHMTFAQPLYTFRYYQIYDNQEICEK